VLLPDTDLEGGLRVAEYIRHSTATSELFGFAGQITVTVLRHAKTKAVRADVRLYRASRRRCLELSEIGMTGRIQAACKSKSSP
jgi:hypothetical protein